MLWLFLACNKDENDTKIPSDAPTWYADVAPIVSENCSGCHQNGGAAFDLTDPARATGMASAMASAVSAGIMPPWGAVETDDCTPLRPWKGDRRLSDEEIATIVAWAEADAPLGDAATAADAPVAPPENLEGDVLELPFESNYLTRGGADELVCLALDPQNTEDLWVDGVQVVPSNLSISHHTLVMLDTESASDALVNSDGWYDCSGSTGLGNAELLATWVPGMGPTYAPEGTGIRIPAGAKLVLQMHYHPSGAVGEEDRPTLRLRQLPSPAAKGLHSTLIGNYITAAQGLQAGPNDRAGAEFRIPANVAGHTEEMWTTFSDPIPEIPIPMVGAHMHLVGTGMSVWLERATPSGDEPSTECLLPASRYDYDWQQLYRYEGDLSDMPTLSSGDTLVIRCTYDNTMDNPGVVRALADAGRSSPTDVYLGEGTLDEMCIGVFSYVY